MSRPSAPEVHPRSEKSPTPEDTPNGRSENPEVAAEQAYVTMLYDRLDDLRQRTQERLAEVMITPAADNKQGPVERDDFAATHRIHSGRLDQVEDGLCFGRLDLEREDDEGDTEKLYIGRIGLMSEDYDSLLVDWRAPAAQPFYRATYADRCGVVRRRHIHTRGRVVTGLDDDVLDLEAIADGERSHLMGEGALLASLEAGRTGRMSDIVATIQAEQDRIIRSDLDGILVVEGGPGTGKTVVALHRAAYLLYTHRERLSKRGVLVLGPNPTFVRYIGQVLPSLGETDVVMATLGELYPGIRTRRLDPPAAAVVKGDLRMVDVLTEAVRARQWVPEDALEITAFDGFTYRLDQETCIRARARARDTGLVHNRARRYLVDAILDTLTEQGVEMIGREFVGMYDPASIRRELAGEPAVRAALDMLWPELTPQRLLADLYSDPDFLAAVAPNLAPDERAALLREEPQRWTVADVPLLDEIARLVGETDLAVYTARQAAEHARVEAEEAERYARNIAVEAAEAESYEDEEGFVVTDTALIAERYSERVMDGSIADRALLDREWEFGYAIVDEAQELSPMAWRLVFRRCPGKSMTIVGDVAQTSAAEGATSWAAALEPFAPGRWRRERLSVNYRTPAEIMAVAADVLAAAGPDVEAPRSVRHGDDPPWALGVGSATELAAVLPEVVREELAAIGEGRVALIAPAGRIAEVAAMVPGAATDDDLRMLDAPVAVLAPGEAKGLEFDSVVVVDPQGILDAGTRGLPDLYVALTRATRRLGIVHDGALPPVLARVSHRDVVTRREVDGSR